MYYNIVYTDLVIKGLVRVFVSFQKEKVFINLKKTNKVFVVMQTRHTRLEKFILAEPVSMVIFCILAAIFMVCTALFLISKTNPCQAQLCPAACGSAQPWPMRMSTQTLFCFTGEPHPSLGGLSLALCLLMGSLRASAHHPLLHRGVSPGCSQCTCPAARSQDGQCRHGGTAGHGSACACR